MRVCVGGRTEAVGVGESVGCPARGEGEGGEGRAVSIWSSKRRLSQQYEVQVGATIAEKEKADKLLHED